MTHSLARLSLGSLLVVAFAAVTPAWAQTAASGDTAPRVGVAARASTLGWGGEVALALTPKVNIRTGFNMLDMNDVFEQDDDNVTYKGTIRLRSGHAYVDWFPFSSGFHVSPGLVFANSNRATLRGIVPSGDQFSIDDGDYVSGPGNPVTAIGEVTFASVRPAIMVGWGNLVPRSRRWSVPFELGVVFTGAPKGTLGFTGTVCDVGGGNCRNIANDAIVQARIREEEATLNDDIKVLKVYPVLSIGFAVRF